MCGHIYVNIQVHICKQTDTLAALKFLHICIYMFVHLYVKKHIHSLRMFTDVCTHMCKHTCTYMQTYTNIDYLQILADMHICVKIYVDIHICTRIHICICTYECTNTYLNQDRCIPRVRESVDCPQLLALGNRMSIGCCGDVCVGVCVGA